MFGLGLLGPLIAGGIILGALGGLYQCVYQRGADDAEAANLRATIEAGRKAQTGTRAAYARVGADLANARRETTALRAEIERISSLPPPPSGDASEPQEPHRCEWDDLLPWPPAPSS